MNYINVPHSLSTYLATHCAIHHQLSHPQHMSVHFFIVGTGSVLKFGEKPAVEPSTLF